MKKLSFGMVMFVYLPLAGAIGLTVFFAFKYWYVTLAAIVFAMMIIGMVRGGRETADEDLESRIAGNQYARSAVKQDLLREIGAPAECINGRLTGDFSPDQKALWREFKRLDAEDKRLLKDERTALVNAGR